MLSGLLAALIGAENSSKHEKTSLSEQNCLDTTGGILYFDDRETILHRS